MFFADLLENFFKYLKNWLFVFLKMNINRSLKVVPVNEMFLPLVYLSFLRKRGEDSKTSGLHKNKNCAFL